jgi:hypothetical protein
MALAALAVVVGVAGWTGSGAVQAMSQANPPKATAKAAAKHATAANHATTGVVKSVDANTLVITRPGKKGGEMTFTLNPSTHREGTVEVGSNVSVRYQEDGSSRVATAITARPAKQTEAHKTATRH